MSVRDYEALAAGLGPEAGKRAREVASATGSVLAELPGGFSAEEEADVEGLHQRRHRRPRGRRAHRGPLAGALRRPGSVSSDDDPYRPPPSGPTASSRRLVREVVGVSGDRAQHYEQNVNPLLTDANNKMTSAAFGAPPVRREENRWTPVPPMR